MTLNKRRAIDITFSVDDIIVTLSDGSKISNPLSWHPWLLTASESERQAYELYSDAILWLNLDEGIDIEGMLRGIRPKHLQETQG